nr:conjugal transfer mating-pair stabilization protein TraG [uncultured Pantoea sp.]
MDTIYTIMGGGWFRDSLNAVATFFQMNDWRSIVSMATTISVVVAAMVWVRGKDILTFVRWAAAMVLVIGVLVGVKRPVQIIDLSDLTQVYRVDNVPVGLSLPFSLITSVGHALVQGYETIFHQPDALTYSRTGMLFGAELMGRSADFFSANPDMTGLFSDYVQNCVIGDIMLNHKYSMYDLMHTSDPYALIFSKPSPLRGVFDRTGTFQTCQWAAQELQTVMDTDTREGGQTWTHYVRDLFGTRPDAAVLFGEMMGDSYRYFYGAGQSASDIMKRNVTISALRRGIPAYAARNGDTASLLNLASETSYSRLRMSQATAADIATKTLPVMQSVLTGVLLGMFPLVMIMALISVLTLEVIKGYVFSIAYLQCWPVLFAILNNAMNFYLSVKTGSTPVTLANISMVQQQYSDIATTAGWLALSIPFMAGGIVFGLHRVMSQAGSYLGSALQSTSAQSGAQAVDGTWAFNNLQTDNVQGSKWDTNSSYASGQMTTQAGSGALRTVTSDGGSVINAQPAISKLATDISFSRAQSSTAQRLARESDVQAQSALQGYNQSVNTGYSLLKQFASQAGHTDGVTESAGRSEATTASQAAGLVLSAVQSFARRNNVSESEAVSQLNSMSKNDRTSYGVGGQFGINSSKTLWGKAGEVFLGVSGKGDLHGSIDTISDRGRSDSLTDGITAGQDISADRNAQDARDFRQGLDKLVTHRADQSAQRSDTEGSTLLDQIGATFSRADSQYDQYTTSRTRSHEYSEMASASESITAGMQGNYTQEFVGWVQQHAPDRADRVLTNTGDAGAREEREALAGQFMEERLRARVEGNFASHRGELGTGMAAVQGDAAPRESLYERGGDAIDARGEAAGVRTDTAGRAEDALRGSREEISKAGQTIGSRRGLIGEDRSGLEAAFNMADGNFRDKKEETGKKVK